MFKALFGIIRLVLILLVAALIFHNLAARTALSWGLRYSLGVPVTIESAQVDFWSSSVRFENVTVHNADDFLEGYVLKVPSLTLSFDSGAFFDGRVRFKKIEADVSDFQILRAPNGRVNWFDLKPIRKTTDKNARPGTVIEHFILSIRRGTVRDLTRSQNAAQNFVMDVDRRDYLGLHTVEDITKLISYEALKRMGMLQLGAGSLDQMREDLEFPAARS